MPVGRWAATLASRSACITVSRSATRTAMPIWKLLLACRNRVPASSSRRIRKLSSSDRIARSVTANR